jgi:hypothetical protein
MKKILLTSIFAGLLAFQLHAQESQADSTDGAVNRVYKVFGNTWYVVLNEDGSKSYEWETKNHDNYHEVSKNSKIETHFLNTDLGINIWPIGKGAPEVKPWGSWYVDLHSSMIWKPSKNFRLKSALGVNWYNFKFEDRDIIAVKTPDGLEFQEFTNGTGTKSKISASFANLTLVPSIQTNDGNFRLGVGGYAGLRLGGRGKFVYDDAEGEQNKLFEKSNMYVNNFRYGLRGEIGIGEIDLFFNYDLNDLFQPGKGPVLQAMSFGITFR